MAKFFCCIFFFNTSSQLLVGRSLIDERVHFPLVVCDQTQTFTHEKNMQFEIESVLDNEMVTRKKKHEFTSGFHQKMQ